MIQVGSPQSSLQHLETYCTCRWQPMTTIINNDGNVDDAYAPSNLLPSSDPWPFPMPPPDACTIHGTTHQPPHQPQQATLGIHADQPVDCHSCNHQSSTSNRQQWSSNPSSAFCLPPSIYSSYLMSSTSPAAQCCQLWQPPVWCLSCNPCHPPSPTHWNPDDPTP